MEAMARGLHESSLDGFYRLARAICVKDITQFYASDLAFLSYFKDIHVHGVELTEQLLDWLRDPKLLSGLTEEQRRALQRLDIDKLRKMFEERLREQHKRHEGGKRRIGTRRAPPVGP